MSYSYAIYVGKVLRFSYHARENISTKYKNIRGKRVPLSNAPVRFKILGGFTINKNRKRNSGNTSHDSLN
jgi:hypothetical protein